MDEHDFAGGYTIVKDYVRSAESYGRRDAHSSDECAGRAGADFGEVLVAVARVEQKTH
jgi:hypothetical protein